MACGRCDLEAKDHGPDGACPVDGPPDCKKCNKPMLLEDREPHSHGLCWPCASEELERVLLQVDELKDWIWDQGHIRAAAHRAEDCARCKLEAKEGRTQKRNDQVCDSCGWNNGPDHGGGRRVMYTVGKVTKCGSCLPTTR
jgi:hypothetical protein